MVTQMVPEPARCKFVMISPAHLAYLLEGLGVEVAKTASFVHLDQDETREYDDENSCDDADGDCAIFRIAAVLGVIQVLRVVGGHAADEGRKMGVYLLDATGRQCACMRLVNQR